MRLMKLAVLCMALLMPNLVLGSGASGAKIVYAVQGKIGNVEVNPYKIAPLTAIIRSNGYYLKNASVKIVPKKGGIEIAYKVQNKHLLTHGGIPIFGLYPDHSNTVLVSYTKTFNGKDEKVKDEKYRIYAAPVYAESIGDGKGVLFNGIEVKKINKKFKDRLYLVNNIAGLNAPMGSQVVWNNPTGGSLEWGTHTRNFIIDTTGEVRWYMLPNSIYDVNSILDNGIMMGFRQNKDGKISWGYGMRYAKYDIMGRKIFNRVLPRNYIDFSHSMNDAQNGHYFLKVASANHKRPDGKNVRTVRDVIVEVDSEGDVVEEWPLYDIMDPYRDVNLLALDQGAVCLNLDAEHSGQTMSAEEMAKLDENDHFGDITGSGVGRNWAHTNSVDYDPTDDSIIVSMRHQSAVVKIGRDKKIKWILASHEGWKKQYQNKLLAPVDSKGRKIKCEGSVCEGNFDWTWTQHSNYRIDSKSKGNIFYTTVFDNGDSRGMEQPALSSMKYSRAVVYKIDQKKMTIEQIWEYGKERGYSWFSPVTSTAEYQDDKNSIFVYSATAGLGDVIQGKPTFGSMAPVINEFKWGAKEPSVEIVLKGAFGYQAYPFSVSKAFSR